MSSVKTICEYFESADVLDANSTEQTLESATFVGTCVNKKVYLVVIEGFFDDDLISRLNDIKYRWITGRQLLVEDLAAEFEIHARAIQLFHWLDDHRFCGRCGAKTYSHRTETALSCVNCSKLWYPRIQPCVITLIHRNDKILLARHGRYITDMFSCIAGFVESGETLEAAVHREVKEEVGFKIHNLSYFKSQAWPFPNQLMIGYFAEYHSGDIVVDGDEILEAKWWGVDELPNIPPMTSIAGELIAEFCRKHR
jgi:NAD+ diphosphatase